MRTVRKWAVERIIWHMRLLSIQMSLLLAEEYLCNELMDFMLCDLHKAQLTKKNLISPWTRGSSLCYLFVFIHANVTGLF